MDDSFDTNEVLKQVFLKCLNAPNVMSPDLYLYYKGLQDRKIIINSSSKINRHIRKTRVVRMWRLILDEL